METHRWIADPLNCASLCPTPTDHGLHDLGDGIAYCDTHSAVRYADGIREREYRVLTSSASDASASCEDLSRLPACVTAWWSNNAMCQDIRPVPIGFVWSADRHAGLAKAVEQPKGDRLLYLCHSEHTRPPIDRGLYPRFPWATRQGGRTQNDVSPLDYALGLRAHRFVLSPQGAGIDTHRIWEALAMQCQPVVRRNPIHREWIHLPIVWIDSWSEVTEEFLINQPPVDWQDMPELTGSYWRQKIQAR